MKKARGSALIIAFMLVAAVGGTVLLIGRLFLMDQASSEIYEDSVVAYYSAESGIEEALLRYRYDKDIEMPVNGRGDFLPNSVARSDIVSNSEANKARTASINPDGNQRFDLTMKNLGSYYGMDADKNRTFNKLDLANPNYIVSNDYIVPKDESIKLNIQDSIAGSNDIDLYVRPLGAFSNSSFMELKITGKNPGGVLIERKLMLYFDAIDNITVCPVASDCVKMTSPTATAPAVYGKDDIKNALVTAGVSFKPNEDVILAIKPVNVKIAIGLKPTNGVIVMPYTDVESTGYFAGYSRTLSAKIDRQSGTVYDLFDYVVYDKK